MIPKECDDVYLDAPPLAVEASSTALGMASPLQPLSLLHRRPAEAQLEIAIVDVATTGQAPRVGIRRRVHSS